jgi:membrane protease subunit HflC
MSSLSPRPAGPDLRRAVIGGSVAIAGLILLLVVSGAFYTLDQAQQAVVLQFGRPVHDEPITEPGLHFKMPFTQEVRFFDKRIQAWDGDPNQIPTRGREFISVDTTARWKIVDALKFLQSVRDEAGALSRLDDILDSVVRDMISSTDLVELVRSADWAVSAEDLQRALQVEENLSELTKPIEIGRQKLEEMILAEAQKTMPQYGIELVDLKIKRLNYIDSVRKQVFGRMVSERQRVAEQFRSEGEGEASRIRGDTARELAVVRSEAKRRAEVVRGEADAEATRIYSEAYSADPEFFAFLRTLQSYQESLGERATFLLGADSDYFRYLREISPAKK